MASPAGQWAPSILSGIGAPVTPRTVQDLNAWQRAEGGTATNNPFNTTQPFQGATNYNSVGVKNYGTPQAGIAATVKTLRNGRYSNIIKSLVSGGDPTAFSSAISDSPWGSNGKLVGQILGAKPVQGSTASSTAPLGTSLGRSSPATTSSDQTRIALSKYLMKNSMALLNNGPAQPSTDLFNLVKTLAKTEPPTAPTGAGLSAATRNLMGIKSADVNRSIVSTAKTQLGTPYQWGGTAKLGAHTDCSGLVQAVMGANGITVPRTSYEQWHAGKPVDLNAVQPGDELFFEMGAQGPGHVGLYIGNGKFIEDPHTGDVVKIQSLSNYATPVGARRFT